MMDGDLLVTHSGVRRLYAKGYITGRELSILFDIRAALWELSLGPGSYLAPSISRFNHWVDTLSAIKIPVGPVLDFLDLQLPFSQIDQNYHRRKGWARAMFSQALHHYPSVRLGNVQPARRSLSHNSSRRNIYASRANCASSRRDVHAKEG